MMTRHAKKQGSVTQNQNRNPSKGAEMTQLLVSAHKDLKEVITTTFSRVQTREKVEHTQ